jgi:hypothetical protein
LKWASLTHYVVSYSHLEGKELCYVQDNIRLHGEKLSHLIMNGNAIVYVCGDAKNMSKNIKDAFFDILAEYVKKEDLDEDERRWSLCFRPVGLTSVHVFNMPGMSCFYIILLYLFNDYIVII